MFRKIKPSFRQFLAPVVIASASVVLVVSIIVYSQSTTIAHQTRSASFHKSKPLIKSSTVPTSTATAANTHSTVVTPPAASRAKVTKVATVVVPAPSSNVKGLTPAQTPPSNTSSHSPPPAVSYFSTNWSGYLSTSGLFSSVAALWSAPQPTGIPGVISGDSTWVGVGGVTSGDLIQVGTQNLIAPSGAVSTSAFYELLPSAAQTIPITVTPGNTISASVTLVSGTLWSIKITDLSSGQSFTTTVSYSSSKSSAEWIEEDPTFAASGRLVPFDNFGTVTFSGGATIDNGSLTSLSGSQAQSITLVNSSGQPQATPSAIGVSGDRFTITHN